MDFKLILFKFLSSKSFLLYVAMWSNELSEMNLFMHVKLITKSLVNYSHRWWEVSPILFSSFWCWLSVCGSSVSLILLLLFVALTRKYSSKCPWYQTLAQYMTTQISIGNPSPPPSTFHSWHTTFGGTERMLNVPYLLVVINVSSKYKDIT